jgi:hypothetical protein
MRHEGVLLLLAAIHTAAGRSIAWQQQHAVPSSRMTATLVRPGLGSAWHGTAPTDWSLTHSSSSAMQEGEVTHQLSLVSSQSLTLTSHSDIVTRRRIYLEAVVCMLKGAHSIAVAVFYNSNYLLHQIFGDKYDSQPHPQWVMLTDCEV